MRLVHEHRLAPACRPAGDAFVEADRRPHDLVGVLVAREHGSQHGVRLVGLVDRQRVVRDQVVQRVGDADEQGIEALLGQHLVEEVSEPPVRLDQLGRLVQHRVLRQQPEMRGRPHNHSTQGSPFGRGLESPG